MYWQSHLECIIMTDDAGIRTVSHDGKVVGAAGNKILVKIISRSACAQCDARGICGPADSEEKIIAALAREPLREGDPVTVIMEERLGQRAVFYGFFLPFMVMITVLFTAYALGSGEIIAALLGIGSLVPYYLVLHLSREKIEKDFVFRVEKKNPSRVSE
jgi:sigma-E factor negative regulatory protein RseC